MPELESHIGIPKEVAAFDRSEHVDRYRIVALGDSTTLCVRQEKGQRWPDLLESKCGPSAVVVNAGMGGTSSSLGLHRWSRDVAPADPQCVIINFLLNDSHIRFYECRTSYLVQCSIDRMESNLHALIDLSRGLGASPVIWTPPPVPPYHWTEVCKSDTQREIQFSLLERYTARVETVAADRDVPLANLWRDFPGLVDEYPGRYFDEPDGYHSNVQSQPIIADQISRHVIPLVVRWKSGRAE